MRKKNTRKGFTIVELVIVIAVIGILAAVLIPTFGSIITDAKDSANLQEARNTLTEYLIDHAKDGNSNFIIRVGAPNEYVYYAVVNGELKDVAYTVLNDDNATTTDALSDAFTNGSIADANNDGVKDGVTVKVGSNNNIVYVVTITTPATPNP